MSESSKNKTVSKMAVTLTSSTGAKIWPAWLECVNDLACAKQEGSISMLDVMHGKIVLNGEPTRNNEGTVIVESLKIPDQTGKPWANWQKEHFENWKYLIPEKETPAETLSLKMECVRYMSMISRRNRNRFFAL